LMQFKLMKKLHRFARMSLHLPNNTQFPDSD
jgi:hypothetical protein